VAVINFREEGILPLMRETEEYLTGSSLIKGEEARHLLPKCSVTNVNARCLKAERLGASLSE
jgi:hypothetical protein